MFISCEGDGIAARGLAYGIHTLRVDGNDLFAVHAAVAEVCLWA